CELAPTTSRAWTRSSRTSSTDYPYLATHPLRRPWHTTTSAAPITSIPHRRPSLRRFSRSTRRSMLNQQTIEKLYTMRMRGMADGFTQQQEDPQTTQLSFEERFALLVDRQRNWRQNRARERRLRDARLQGPACMEDIDSRAGRGLDKQVVRSLIQDSDWVRRHQHIFLVGPTGIGKTYLARAFGQKACRDGFTAYFATAAQLFREREGARADGSYAKKLRALGQVDALIVDDWAMAPLTDAERRAFLEICDERYLTKATLLTSQLPVANWHEIGRAH